jgi:hypothetical protein
MNFSYMIYQAERPLSIMEQRETDVQAAELAAAFAGAGRAVKVAAARLFGANRPKTPVIPGDDLIQAECVRR